MKEVFTMWRYTQMVVLVALSAAIYAAVLIPFKGFPLVPGYIELRPANAFPIVFGLLFGPAGAWGAAIGNLIGDFFGTLTLGSVGGFVGTCWGWLRLSSSLPSYSSTTPSWEAFWGRSCFSPSILGLSGGVFCGRK
jgi:hypothetical protein